MSSEFAICVNAVSKCYHIYDRPQDRLKQALLRGRRRYFREFWALQEVSFDIAKGETVGIIGRNGSGKSTLLQMICGTLTPTSGLVRVNGRVAALLELGAGFNPEFTGRENVLMNAIILGMSRLEVEERFEEIVRFSELGDFIEQPVKTYSSGMYVRLAFSIAVNVSPMVLIVDEALSVGDARFQAKCMRRIKEIQQLGATILFVSHDVAAVRTLCQRAIWLDQGRIRMMGDVFPVSGHYMEYMFKDDVATFQAIESPTTEVALPETTNTSQDGGVSQPDELDKRPVTHWGSHTGVIKSAGIFDAAGNRAGVIHWGEEVTVRIILNVPADIVANDISAAFSIKNLNGTDLVVSATYDYQEQHCRDIWDSGSIIVEFSFRNYLVNGKYLLVAAVEDRSSTAIHYYEYIEGAHYFSSLSEKRYFGIFQPEIRQSLSKNFV